MRRARRRARAGRALLQLGQHRRHVPATPASNNKAIILGRDDCPEAVPLELEGPPRPGGEARGESKESGSRRRDDGTSDFSRCHAFESHKVRETTCHGGHAAGGPSSQIAAYRADASRWPWLGTRYTRVPLSLSAISSSAGKIAGPTTHPFPRPPQGRGLRGLSTLIAGVEIRRPSKVSRRGMSGTRRITRAPPRENPSFFFAWGAHLMTDGARVFARHICAERRILDPPDPSLRVGDEDWRQPIPRFPAPVERPLGAADAALRKLVFRSRS